MKNIKIFFKTKNIQSMQLLTCKNML